MSQFVWWLRSACSLAESHVLAVDVEGDVPENWRRTAEKGERFDLVVIGRRTDARELARLVRRLKPGRSHVRVFGSVEMPPAGWTVQTGPVPGVGLCSTVWK